MGTFTLIKLICAGCGMVHRYWQGDAAPSACSYCGGADLQGEDA